MNDLLGCTTAYPIIIPKKWGYERIIANNKNYCGKQLVMVAGKSCSVHYHLIKSETFFLESGRMEICYHDNISELKAVHDKDPTGEKIFELMEHVTLHQGQTFHVPVGRVHRMMALEDCSLFEFSTHDSPKDSYRIIESI